MKIKYLGISALCFNDGQNTIFFDPCLSRPSLKELVLSKLQSQPELVDEVLQAVHIDQVSAIFVSHSHYDHALDLGYLAQKFEAQVYGSKSTLNIARGAKIPEDCLTQFEKNTDYQLGQFTIRVLPSVHSRPFFFNNNLGQEIERALPLPARAGQFKEGGSYDFLLKNQGHSFLIRPSFGYLPGELKNIHADYLFLGTTTLSRENQAHQIRFFKETIDQVKPKVVVPLHWDNFTRSLKLQTTYLPFAQESNYLVQQYCLANGIKYLQMPPLSELDI